MSLYRFWSQYAYLCLMHSLKLDSSILFIHYKAKLILINYLLLPINYADVYQSDITENLLN